VEYRIIKKYIQNEATPYFMKVIQKPFRISSIKKYPRKGKSLNLGKKQLFREFF